MPLVEGDTNIELICLSGHKQSNVSIETNSKETSTTLGSNQTLSLPPVQVDMGKSKTDTLPAIDVEG
jgi:hypothetical protein